MLFDIIVWAIVFGLLFWLITFVPLQEPFRTIAIVVMILLAIIVLLSITGVGPRMSLWHPRN